MIYGLLSRIYAFFAKVSGEDESSDYFRKSMFFIFVLVTLGRVYLNWRQSKVCDPDKEINTSNPTNYVAMIGPADVGKSALLRALDETEAFGPTVPSIKAQSLFIGDKPVVDYPGHPMMLKAIQSTVNDKYVPLVLICIVTKKGHRSIDEAAKLLYNIVTQPGHSFEKSKLCVVGMKGDAKGSITETTELMQLLDEALKNCDGDLADGEEIIRKHAFKDNIVSLKTLKCKKLVSVITSSKNPKIGVSDLRDMILNA